MGYTLMRGLTMKDAVQKDEEIPFDREKFVALLLYLAKRLEADPRGGATKLNKLFFFIDFSAYRRWGKPITGAAYVKKQFGPVPDGIEEIKRELLQRKLLSEKPALDFYETRVLTALVDPDMSRFTAHELELINKVLDDLREYTGSELSALTHALPGYSNSDDFARIPYFTAFLPDAEQAAELPKPSREQIERARKIASDHLGKEIGLPKSRA